MEKLDVISIVSSVKSKKEWIWLAGKCDMLALYEGQLCVIDFKFLDGEFKEDIHICNAIQLILMKMALTSLGIDAKKMILVRTFITNWNVCIDEVKFDSNSTI